MRTLELCSGTGSFSKVAAAFGYATVTVDSDPTFAPTHTVDIQREDGTRPYAEAAVQYTAEN